MPMEAKGFNQENTAGDAPSLCVCRCCGRLLPPDQFYLRRRGGTPEHRCKDCHRRAMRLRRKLVSGRRAEDGGRADIFRVADRNVRLELIRRARQVVRDSMERRLRRVHEQEWEQETRDWTV